MAEGATLESQQTYKQHPIPQHVLGVEFKLIGGLTIRQFGLLAVFLIIAFASYQSGLPPFIKIPLAGGLALLGFFISLVPIQDRPADVWLKNFLVAISLPTERVWRKNPANLDVFWQMREARTLIRQGKELPSPSHGREEVSQYLRRSVQEEGSPLDLAESEFLKSVSLLEADVSLPLGLAASPSTSLTEAEIRPAAAEDEKFRARQEVPLSENLASEVNFSQASVIALPGSGGHRPKFITPIQNVKAGRRLRLTGGELGTMVRGEKLVAAPVAARPSLEELTSRVTEVNQKIAQAVEGRKERSETVSASRSELVGEKALVAQLAPDPSSGAPLPRPEETPTTITKAEEAGRLAALSEELASLREEKEKLKGEFDKEKKARLEAETFATLASEYQKQIRSLADQNNRLAEESKKASAELIKLQEAVVGSTSEKENLARLARENQKRIDELAREKTQATDNLINLERELRELRLRERLDRTPPAASPATAGQAPPPSPVKPGPRTLPFAQNKANIISGSVKAKDGKLLLNAVVIIKDTQGEPVRALKTNELGQFTITTPVVNGQYTLEVSSPGQSFDIMTLEAFGEALDPLEIFGK